MWPCPHHAYLRGYADYLECPAMSFLGEGVIGLMYTSTMVSYPIKTGGLPMVPVCSSQHYRQHTKQQCWQYTKRTLVVFTLTRINKSVVTGQAPVTLELRNTSEKKHKPKVVHAYLTADAVHASARSK